MFLCSDSPKRQNVTWDEDSMKIGMIGLGRMGSNMSRRLVKAGHSCVVFDQSSAAVSALAAEGATASSSAADLISKLSAPRVIWMMVPAAGVDSLLQSLLPSLARGDIVIDGGNSHYADDIRRERELAKQGIRYLDVGTSGGLWGLERGYCLMIGGEQQAVQHLDPIFAALAPGASAPDASTPSVSKSADKPAAAGTASRGYLHCGSAGAGHFVKMVHNGIEYGLMAAYAEGFNLLHKASQATPEQEVSAEHAPARLTLPTVRDFKMNDIAELWRHGSVVSSWLLDLLAEQLTQSPKLEDFAGHVADSGEGRWTVEAAIESSVPVPVLATALFSRFSSRHEDDFANRTLSAMRLGFGGHHELAGKSKT
jgi:6-phosphogluconate dehydrogenase